MTPSSINNFKAWLFPSVMSCLAAMIWYDVNEVKSDVKMLMAQSNIDKTRIDNLERAVFTRRSTSFPYDVPKLPQFMQVVATKPEELVDLTKKI